MDYELASHCVYDDIKIKDPDIKQIKTILGLEITNILKRTGMSKVEAAKKIGMVQNKFDKIYSSKVFDFSIGELISIIEKLDHIMILTSRVKRGRASYTC